METLATKVKPKSPQCGVWGAYPITWAICESNFTRQVKPLPSFFSQGDQLIPNGLKLLQSLISQNLHGSCSDGMRRHLAGIGKRLKSWQEENTKWLPKIAFLAINSTTVERIRGKHSYLTGR
jgi:hypothetical protein